MKLIVSLMLVLSTSVMAMEVTHRSAADVKSVSYKSAGGRGGIVVSVKAVFSNKCWVPKDGELIVTNVENNAENNLVLTLTEVIDRICTAEYMPQTVTIELGTFVRANDASYEKVIVNGVEASTN